MKIVEDLKVISTRMTVDSMAKLYSWCHERIDKPCEDSVLAVAISTNEMLLRRQYYENLEKISYIESDPDWADWYEASSKCAEKWSDRDPETDTPVQNYKGEYIVTEKKSEYDRELEELKKSERFKDFYQRWKDRDRENEKLGSSEVEVQICCIETDGHVSDEMTPRIAAFLYSNSVLNLMRNAN